MKHFDRFDRNLLADNVKLHQSMARPVSSPKLAPVRQNVMEACPELT